MRIILGAILGLAAFTNAITIQQIAEPEKDKHGHDDGCGGNNVNVDIVFKVNMGAESIGTEEAGDLASSTGEETPTSDQALAA